MASCVHYFWHGSDNVPSYTVCSITRLAKMGYTPVVWAYGPLYNVPAECQVRDAGEVISYDWFLTNILNSKVLANRPTNVIYGSFSDVFRAAVLYLKGGWWFDVDVIPLRRLPDVEAIVATCPRRMIGPYARPQPHFETAPDGDVNTSVMFAHQGAQWIGEYFDACRAYFEARRQRAAPKVFAPWMRHLVEKMPPEFAARPLLFNPIPAWTTKLGSVSFGFDVPTAVQIREHSYTLSLSGSLMKARWEYLLAQIEATGGHEKGDQEERAPLTDTMRTAEETKDRAGTESGPPYVIVIRTYNRRATIEKHTLSVLQTLTAPIYIFCGTSEVEMYKKDFPSYHIRDGGESGVALCNQKIADEFPEGQRILQCDDDVVRFDEERDGKLQPAKLPEYVRRGFELCDEHNFKLFGFYPVANAFFMKGRDDVSFGLTFIMGGIHGIINDRRLRTRDQYRDDYERSILSWIHFGGMIRFNKAKVHNIIYRNPGGHALTRTRASMQSSCDYMLRTYPGFCAPKRCKSIFPEIRLTQPRKNTAKGLPAPDCSDSFFTSAPLENTRKHTYDPSPNPNTIPPPPPTWLSAPTSKQGQNSKSRAQG